MTWRRCCPISTPPRSWGRPQNALNKVLSQSSVYSGSRNHKRVIFSGLVSVDVTESLLCDRTSNEVGWWWVIMSPLLLVAWTVAWLIMANPSRNWRFAISAAVGAVSLLVGTFGVYGLIRDAYAQTPPAVNGKCNNFGRNNFNCNTLSVFEHHVPGQRAGPGARSGTPAWPVP
jgi:hypothetical protein